MIFIETSMWGQGKRNVRVVAPGGLHEGKLQRTRLELGPPKRAGIHGELESLWVELCRFGNVPVELEYPPKQRRRRRLCLLFSLPHSQVQLGFVIGSRVCKKTSLHLQPSPKHRMMSCLAYSILGFKTQADPENKRNTFSKALFGRRENGRERTTFWYFLCFWICSKNISMKGWMT